MQKIFRNNRIIAIAFVTLFSGSVSTAALANKNPVVPVELIYAGKINNQPLFQLNVTGDALQNEFTVLIRDEQGHLLYSENIKAENFSKKFLLNTDEIGDSNLQFEIISKKTNQSVTYEVNRHTKTVEDFAVQLKK